MASNPTVHRFTSRPSGAFVNAYLVETSRGVVAVDSTLTVSDSTAFRKQLDDLKKPLLGVLVTHAHPDHYGGLTQLVKGLDVPIVAARGVDEVIRRDDAVKESILRPMFNDEWARERTFPNQVVDDGDTATFDGVKFTLKDLGPGESPHDSVWFMGDSGREVFAGDSAYNHMHSYLADGYYENWLANIKKLQHDLDPNATLRIGHGDPVDPAFLSWQEKYINTFVEAVNSADWSVPASARASVIKAVTAYHPGGDIQFLMELSIEPVATRLGLLAPAA